MSEAPALFRRFPALESRIPRVALGDWPTPLERVSVETAQGARELWVKREDLSARPYAGNKVRKLEFILAEAARCGARTLITAGAAGSHHALATALYGRRHGFDVSLVLFPQRVTPHVREILLLDHALGAELRFTRRMEGVPFAIARARVAHRAARPFVIAPGGSDAFGTLGWVSAGLELVEQLDAQGVTPGRVYVAAGTLGTAAGLALGFALAGRTVPIAAVRITSRIVVNQRAVRSLIGQAAQKLHDAGIEIADTDAAADMVTLEHDAIGDGYGRETEKGRQATEAFAKAGLQLDATYTAKAAAYLLSEPHTAHRPPVFLLTLGRTETMDGVTPAGPAALPAPFRAYLGA